MTFDVLQHSEKMTALLRSETPFVVVTLVEVRGSAPQIVGAKAIVTRAGIEAGTVGGGKIEAACIERAQRLLGDGRGTSCDFVTWNLQTEIGMTCGGEVKLFFEVCFNVDWPIAVFGAGHVAQFLVPLLVQLQCQVTCVDPRAEWLERLPQHPKLKTIEHPHPADVVDAFPAHTFFVLVSKGHAADLPVLKQILATRDAPYLGVIGSAQKASVLKRELRASNFNEAKIGSFHCPIGLPIGNNTPAEISISIIAQLIQRRDELGILKHKTKCFS